MHAGPRPTDGPPPPLPAPGLTARQTHHHTCGVLRTTAPAGLSPPLATSARLGPPSAQGRGRRGAASGREQVGPAGGRAPGGERACRLSPAQGSLRGLGPRRPPAGSRGRGRARAVGGRRRASERRNGSGGGAGGAGRRPGARGRPRRPSPRPGAEQREAAQAAAGPATARQPREAAELARSGSASGPTAGDGRGWPLGYLPGGRRARIPGARGGPRRCPKLTRPPSWRQ